MDELRMLCQAHVRAERRLRSEILCTGGSEECGVARMPWRARERLNMRLGSSGTLLSKVSLNVMCANRKS